MVRVKTATCVICRTIPLRTASQRAFTFCVAIVSRRTVDMPMCESTRRRQCVARLQRWDTAPRALIALSDTYTNAPSLMRKEYAQTKHANCRTLSGRVGEEQQPQQPQPQQQQQQPKGPPLIYLVKKKRKRKRKRKTTSPPAATWTRMHFLMSTLFATTRRTTKTGYWKTTSNSNRLCQEPSSLAQ